MIEIQESDFLHELAISLLITEIGPGRYELSGDFGRYANEQLYAQMMGWA